MPAALVMVIAVATFLVFPVLFHPLSNGHPLAVLVLTIRNLLLVVLLCWSVRRLHGLGKGVAARPSLSSLGASGVSNR